MKNRRNKLYKKLCQERETNIDADDAEFTGARNQFDTYHTQLYENYLRQLAAENYSVVFWRHINGKRKSNTIPCKIVYNNVEATETKHKADLFANFFSSVYTTHPHDTELNDMINQRIDTNHFKIHVTHDVIFCVLKSLKQGNGT